MKSPLSATATMSVLTTLLPLLLLAVLTDGVALFRGTCPQRQPVGNIEYNFTLGFWYEYARYLDGNSSRKCSGKFLYTEANAFIGSNRTFFILESYKPVFGGKFVFNTSLAHFLSNTTVGTFKVAPFPNPRNFSSMTYDILHDDYNETAFIWHCRELQHKLTNQTFNVQYLAIMTRFPFPDQQHQARINGTAAKLNVSMDRLKKTDQTCMSVGNV